MLIQAALVTGLTIAAMGGQFLVRVVLTAQVGPGAELDVFFVSMGWGGALSTALFQAMAQVVAPTTVGAGGDRPTGPLAAAGWLGRRLLLGATALALAGAGLAWWWAGPQAALVALLVLAGWGVAGGVALYQRQFLLAWGRPLVPAVLALLPALAMLVVAAVGLAATPGGFALAGGLAWLLMALAGGVLTRALWRRDGHGPPPGVAELVRRALPVLGANGNSQLSQRSQDACAAATGPGGATLFGNALALARLPQTVGDALFSSLAYPRLLQAQADRDPAAAVQAYRLALRLHLGVAMPAAAAVAVAGEAACAAVFAHGSCSVTEAHRIAGILRWAIPLIVVAAVQAVHAQVMVAQGRTALVLRLEIVCTLATILAMLAAVPFLGPAGVAAGASLGLLAIQVPMLRALTQAGFPWRVCVAEVVRSALPAMAGACVALVGLSLLSGPAWQRCLVAAGGLLGCCLPASVAAIRRAGSRVPQPHT